MPTTLTAELQSLGGRKSAETRLKIAKMSFEARELRRVREQIDITSRAFKQAVEAGDIWRLANALSKLRDDERKLAGRPDPGSYRPVAPKPKSSSGVMPVEE